MKYLFYNPKSNNGNSINTFIDNYTTSELIKINILGNEYYETLNSLTKDDTVILVGGDGTLNHFVNDVKDLDIQAKIYFKTAGTGNDFYNDIKNENHGELVEINKYIKSLPKVIINGKETLFVNGIGFGIDGYCCEEGDRLQAKSDKPVNYSLIAIKGLLFKYRRPNGTVTVDGVTKKYKGIWLAPTMKGKYYGGGMMIAPEQNRLDEENYLTNVIWSKSGKLKTLMIFPSVFKGEHVKYNKYLKFQKCHHVIVEFDRPTALQIDGETVSGVTKYEVIA